MATERLKFRCYRCNQLLAVAPTKAGSIVSCPKCQADLLIPDAEVRTEAARENRDQGGAQRPRKVASEAETRVRAEAAAILGAGPGPPAPQSMPEVLGELAGVIPPDLADLRPEDLRVEAEFFENLSRAPSPPSVVEPAPWPVPESLGSTSNAGLLTPPAPYPADIENRSEVKPPESFSAPVETADRDSRPIEQPTPREELRSIVPPIEIEPPSILPPGAEIRRVSEVVLPAPVVLAWSLFVLAGIAMAFVAGLMIGHFLWKVH